MRHQRAMLCAGVLVATLAGAAPASATLPDDGKLWRAVPETTGLSWTQVASVCPTDGAGRCDGVVGGRDLTGWIWATQKQVIDLMGAYDPAILSADPPSIGGVEHLFAAITFVDDLKPTFFFAGYVETDASTSGWTATHLVSGGASYSYPFWSAGFGLSVVADDASNYRGVWLWRPADDDLAPPEIRANVSGTAGADGWYTSDVAVSWDVQDADSAVTSTNGCDDATVTEDTTGKTFTCTATSSGGTATATTTVMRDTLAPAVTCASPAPVFELTQFPAYVSASVTDATSGPVSANVQALAATSTAGSFSASLPGTDRAGNRTNATCGYRVVVPTCNGLTPTIVGTGFNNVINGTAGRDVIVGLAGSDTIDGKGGDDVICGGDGLDKITGGDGNDWIDGGASNDDLNGGNGDDFLDGGAGTDSIRGDSGRDTCVSGEARMSSCEA